MIFSKLKEIPSEIQHGIMGAAAISVLCAVGVIPASFGTMLAVAVSTGILVSVASSSIQTKWAEHKAKIAELEKKLEEQQLRELEEARQRQKAEDPLYVGLRWIEDHLSDLPPAEEDSMRALLRNAKELAHEIDQDQGISAGNERGILSRIVSTDIPALMANYIREPKTRRNVKNADGFTVTELYCRAVDTHKRQIRDLIDRRHDRSVMKMQISVEVAEERLQRTGASGGQDVSSSAEIAAINDRLHADREK